MEENNQKQPPLLTKSFKGRGTIYFMDMKKTKTDRPYLSITTSRRQKDSEKSERQTIFVFNGDIRGFLQTIAEIANGIEALPELKAEVS